MSKWKTITGTLALAVLGLAVAVTSEAAPRPRGPAGLRGAPGGPGGPLWHDLRLLDLSDEQQAAVRDLLREQHETLKPILEQQRARMRKIHELATTPGVEPAEVGQLVIAAAAVRTQIQEERKKLEESVDALLTSEQRAFWDKLKSARKRARAEEGWGRGPRPGFGPGGAFLGLDVGPSE